MNKKRKINSFLVFTLENELYAIHVKKVLTIVEMHDITRVPKSENYLKGVINLRGEIIPVIDSHIKFKLPPASITMKTSILILELIWSDFEKIKIGLMIDKVEEVIRITKKEILPPPKIENSQQSDYITGMFEKSNEKFIMILDIEKALSLNSISTYKRKKEVKIFTEVA
ncbi:MAG: chemotaxis protein CheW [Bacteroidales bacterium]|nr:chemotaxis protein CheW [Bacteroidales bacterium]MBN2756030.1 chemotaxis protein CheW [Bacteroidales bacterium]